VAASKPALSEVEGPKALGMVDVAKAIPKLVPAKAGAALEAATLRIKCLPAAEQPKIDKLIASFVKAIWDSPTMP